MHCRTPEFITTPDHSQQTRVKSILATNNLKTFASSGLWIEVSLRKFQKGLWVRVCESSSAFERSQKQGIRKFTSDQLIEGCKRARHFVKKPKELHPAVSTISASHCASHNDPKMLLFQSFLSVRATSDTTHKDVYDILALKVLRSAAKTNADREKTSRVWTEFMIPWFGLPIHWFLKGLHDKARSEKSTCIVKCK